MRQAKTLSAHPARRVRLMHRDRAIALAMIAPSALAIAVFVYGFIGWTAYISMTDWRGLAMSTSFVGFDNYLTIFNTGRFQTNIRNLIVFTTFFLASCLVIGLLLAVLVDSRIRAEGFFRSVYIFPDGAVVHRDRRGLAVVVCARQLAQ